MLAFSLFRGKGITLRGSAGTSWHTQIRMFKEVLITRLFTNMWAGCKETTRNCTEPLGCLPQTCRGESMSGYQSWDGGCMKRALWEEFRPGAQDNWIWKVKTKVLTLQRTLDSSSYNFREAWNLQSFSCLFPTPQPRWIYQKWSIFTLSMKPFYPSPWPQDKLRLHSLAPESLCDLAPLPASSFSSCSLTLYKSSHAECLACSPKGHVFFCIQGFPHTAPSALRVASPKLLPLTLLFFSSFGA